MKRRWLKRNVKLTWICRKKEKKELERPLIRKESEPKPSETLRNDSFQATPSPRRCYISNNSTDHEKADSECGTKKGLDKSYEISPYQCSDDEEDEDEDLPIRKCIPSRASKHNAATVLPLQQGIDPDSIFPPKCFCTMDEVLVPGRFSRDLRRSD
ncbi:hypothetical protein KY289_013402 [Solanum tuberosum]|nr:hypothetical protein KY289_013402 [Solanum tuberosum]